MMFNRILCGHDHEGTGKRVGRIFDRDLAFIHCLEQSALRFRRRAIDLIRQDDICKDRSLFELKLVELRVIDRNAEHIGGQQIARELNPVEFAIQGSR